MRSQRKNPREIEQRLTERRNPASKNLDRMSAIEIVRLMNREDRKVAAAVARELAMIGYAVDAIVQKMQQGGRLIYVGAGSSGRIAVLDASECPPTFGTPPQLVRALLAGGKKAITGAVEGAEMRASSQTDRVSGHLGSDRLATPKAPCRRTPHSATPPTSSRPLRANGTKSQCFTR